ncbi:MAG: TasA family protein, partial [Tissierella sp.]|uniref:TasA family protein n=1 Tax=Tissierella sp. TaxID=41274 RepID=UPI003F9BD56C
GTFAWFTATSEEVVNEFTAGTVKINLVDNFEGAPNVNPGDCYEKEVYVENTGTKKALIRIKKDIAFADESGLSLEPVIYELGENWEEHDGYFYYMKIVEKEGKTKPLFKDNKICFDGASMNDDYQGAKLDITIKAEAIQATNGAAAAEWEVDFLPNIDNNNPID